LFITSVSANLRSSAFICGSHASTADERGCTQIDQSKVSDDPLHFNLGFSKIDEKADFQPRRLEVIEALSHVDFIQSLDGFELDDDGTFHKQVSEVVANHFAPPRDGNGVLLENHKTRALNIDA
jgi:hypothetical protein